MHFDYPATIKQDDEGFFQIRFRDLPPAITYGESLGSAKTEAADCLEEAIAAYIAGNMEIPEPSQKRQGEISIRISAQFSAKAALYVAFKKSGLSKSQFAEKLDVSETEARRMLNARHNTKLTTMETALEVLGYQLSVSMLPAA
ncbi:MAG: type II toxin-antitoxin system HicB family antitoxin [Desulfobacteraceae bacterium]